MLYLYTVLPIVVWAALWLFKTYAVENIWPRAVQMLDVLVPIWWVAAYFVWGYTLGYSPVLWLLLGWFVIGIGLGFWLLQFANWRPLYFWRRFWQWSGLAGAVLWLIGVGMSLYLG